MSKRYSYLKCLLSVTSIVLALGFFNLAWVVPPEIYSITPDMGINNVPTQVTMDGSGFQPTSKVALYGGGPYKIGSCDTTGSSLGVYIASAYAYVADGGSELQVIEKFSPLTDIQYMDSGTLIAAVPAGYRPGTYNLHVTNSDGGHAALHNAFTSFQDEVEVTIKLPAGWSMISLPVRPDVTIVTTLFPEAVVVYKYEKGTGYVRVQAGENLEVGMGYWILLNNPQSYVISGTAITKYMIPVADGWYMIGGCTLPAQKMVISGKIDVIYGYTQGVGYERLLGSEPLEQGRGYWILFSNTSEGAAFTASDQSGLMLANQVTGEVAYAHTAHLYGVFGQRDAGTEQELLASQYIAEQFEGLGYDVEVQPFSFVDDDDGVLYCSQNVIATKPGAIDQQVIVGAHYDCLFDILIQNFGCSGDQLPGGAVDNASGVGVIMEVAKVLAEYELYGTIKFVAFGAEELGLHGSIHYTSQMSVDEIESTIAMINLDSIGGGDFPYVYSGSDGNPGWVRDLALNIAYLMGYDLKTSPETPYFEAGTIGDWSDHAPFKYLGIPIACFEWFNWDLGYESEQYTWIMHSCNDTMTHITEDELDHTADVVTALVFELTNTPLPKPEKGTARARQYIRVQRRPGIPIQ